MDDVQNKVAALAGLIQREIPDHQAETMLARIHERRHRQDVTRAVLAAALVFGLAGYGVHGMTTEGPLEAEQAWPQVVHLGDGTTAVPLTAETQMKLVSESPKKAVFALTKGQGRFEVTPSETREVRIRVDEVTVRVLGTAFEVSRRNGEVDVTVMRGKVEVSGPQGRQLLTTGQRGTFVSRTPRVGATPPPALEIEVEADAAAAPVAVVDARVVAPTPVPVDERVVTKTPSKRAPAKKNGPAAADPASAWKRLAKGGDYGAAHAALKAPGARVAKTPEELLFAADVARRSGHPRAAVPFLEDLVKRFSKDPQAPMAAFSLGRILLYQLGNPAAAAKRFAQAWSLNPTGALAEDALAREAEAWSRAGQPDRAKMAAGRYLKAYPKGHRLDAVKRFGGLE